MINKKSRKCLFIIIILVLVIMNVEQISNICVDFSIKFSKIITQKFVDGMQNSIS